MKKAFALIIVSVSALNLMAGNLLLNPSFETNGGFGGSSAANWTNTGRTGVETWASHTGGWGMSFYCWSGTSGGLYQDVAVTAGTEYEFEIWALDDAAAVTTSVYTMVIEWYQGTTLLSSTSEGISSQVTNAWRKPNLTGTAPTGSNKARVMVTGDNMTSGETLKIDDANFGQPGTPTVNAGVKLLVGYEPSETNLILSSPDTGMTLTKVLGGAGGVPVATQGSYVLKATWTGQPDGKVEIKHQGLDFDLVNYDSLLIDVYMPSQLSPTGVWIFDDVIIPNWQSVESLPTAVGQWCTLEINVSDCNQSSLNHIYAFIFEGMPVSAGTLYIDNIRLNPRIFASSYQNDDYLPKYAVDSNLQTRWNSEFSEPQWITIDLSELKTVNEVLLNWETACAQKYHVQVSEDGVIWHIVYANDSGNAGENIITFDPVSVRYVRMYGLLRKTDWGMSLWEFEVFLTTDSPVPLSNFDIFDENSVLPVIKGKPKSWYNLKAKLDPRGEYPKWFYDEYSYWTVVGEPNAEYDSLFSDEGMIDNYQNSFSLIPYLYINGSLIKPSDVNIVIPPLENGYLPILAVKWIWDGGITFEQKLFSSGTGGKTFNYVWYTLENTSASAITGKLFLTVRPFQITPDWLFGGYVNINSIERAGNIIKVNDSNGFVALTSPDSFGALSYENGDIMDFIRNGNIPSSTSVSSTMGYASAALAYNLNIDAGAAKEYKFIIPSFEDDINTFNLPLDDANFISAYNVSKNLWLSLLNRVSIDIPDSNIVNTFKSNLAYILVQKDGPAIQPGSRNYDRSWMRDGATMGAFLLRTGHFQAVKDYLDWITGFQYANGRIPPIVHSEGFEADRDKTINEYDAQGEYIYLISEYYKFTKDTTFLQGKYPAIIKALQYLEALRSAGLTDYYKYGNDDIRRYYGILPESIAHEGYPEPGVHNYWDDFWGIKGWEEAIKIAEILNKPSGEITWMVNEKDNFQQCVSDSIKLNMQVADIQYLPASVELSEFDATSTAIAVWPTEQLSILDMNDLLFTLDKYYNETFIPRDTGGLIYGYTPYEIRTATSYLMLGQKDKALRMINYFLKDRRPAEWNHWGEVVYPDYYNPGYTGDMPHSWIGAIYNNLISNLFVYAQGEKLILGAGINEQWLNQQAVDIEHFPTYFGEVNYTVTKVSSTLLRVQVSGDAIPPDGFVFKYPFSNEAIRAVTVNGQTWGDFSETEVFFTDLPADIYIYKQPRMSGLDYEYYEGTWDSLPNFDSLTPIAIGIAQNFDIALRQQDDYFAFRFTGYIEVPSSGTYTFYTNSDDGSNLYIGNNLVVNNDGRHGMLEKNGTINLNAGKHPITVTFFEKDNSENLIVSYAGPEISKTQVPDNILFRCDLEGDLTSDCLVNFNDLKMLADNWLSDYDFLDFAQLAQNWFN